MREIAATPAPDAGPYLAGARVMQIFGRVQIAGIVAIVACKHPPPAVPDATVPDATVPDATVDGPPVTEGPASGTRLRLQWVDFDGSRGLPAIFDRDRNEVCAATSWSGGATYCTPAASPILFYADPQCTQPLSQDPTYAFLGTPNCDPSVTSGLPIQTLYRVGAVQPDAYVYMRMPDGSCLDYGTTDSPVYAVGEPVPTSALVPLTSELSTASGPLVQTWWTSADGLRIPKGVRDTARAADCDLIANGSNAASSRCLPGDRAMLWLFADSACTSPAVAYVASCPVPSVVSDTSCFAVAQPVYSIGAPIPILYGGPQCVAVSDYAGRALGPLVDLPELARGPATSTARVVPVRHVLGTAGFDDARLLFDNELHTECIPQTIDGVLRCRPALEPLVSRAYADAACTVAIRFADISRGTRSDCPVPDPGTHVFYADQAFKLEGLLTDPLYQDVLGTCKPLPGPYSNLDRYRVTPVPTSALAAGQLVIE